MQRRAFTIKSHPLFKMWIQRHAQGIPNTWLTFQVVKPNGRAMVRYMLGTLPVVQNIKNMEVWVELCYVLKTISSCCYYTNICYSGLLTTLLTYVGYFIEYWCDFVAPRYEYSMPCSIVKCLMMWFKNHEIIHPSWWSYWTTITHKKPRK